MKPIEVTAEGRLSDSRINVYDVVYYHLHGDSPTTIAVILGISTPEVRALLGYFEAHRDAVLARHHEIEARNARGNPPEIEEKLKASREKFAALLAERRRQLAERNGECHPG